MFQYGFGFLMELNNLTARTELNEHYPLNLELRNICGEGWPLMDIKGPLNLIELYVKCCMSGDFSGEMVQGILRFLKRLPTQSEFQIYRFSPLLLREHTHNPRTLANNYGINYILLNLLNIISLNQKMYSPVLRGIHKCCKRSCCFIQWLLCRTTPCPCVRHGVVSPVLPSHKGCCESFGKIVCSF